MDGTKTTPSKIIAHFSFARSVLWLIVITVLFEIYFNEIHEDFVRKYFSAIYQFYVLFSIYAYVKLIDGLNYVSS